LVDDTIAQDEIINRTLQLARAEYTVMPRFALHQPVDYLYETLPPDFGGPPIGMSAFKHIKYHWDFLVG
jgi:hypothetical protein